MLLQVNVGNIYIFFFALFSFLILQVDLKAKLEIFLRKKFCGNSWEAL